MAGETTREMQIWIITPFERPDVDLVYAAARAGAFPVLHLGRDRAAAETAISELAALPGTFGVCLADDTTWKIKLPDQVSKIIIPWGMEPPDTTNAEIVWQAKTAADVEKAIAAKTKSLIFKSVESAGLCAEDSSFMLFQKMIASCLDAGVSVFVQGGVGVHTAAAFTAFGVSGVVLDSQIALFPECSLSQTHKTALGKLSGNEIRVCEGFNYYVFPGSNEPADFAELDELLARFSTTNNDVLPLGQDVVLAPDLADEYKRLKYLVRALKRSTASHVSQARIKDSLSQSGEAAETLGTVYPIAQGPMARVSDEPDFLRSVADGGGLPFLAMSMMKGKTAEDTLHQVAAVMNGQPWGVGILGFTYPKTLEEQTKLILETHPPFVLIAGGRPAQAKVFEQAGIRVLLHAPTSGLLDMFLREGSDTFVFEGRESGGHVGPLYSMVLWEKQINRILKMDNPSKLCLFFAGGIHDALSAAFVRVMTGPLASRSAKICLLCGTAYLYTEEAVRYGAITDTYQRLLIESNKTLLIKSGRGQETRCVPSPFTAFFLNEKTRMEEEGLETGEIILKLEALNLGRLRIASKGLERTGGELAILSEEEQIENGLYMTGEVTALTENTTTIADLHKNLTAGSLKLLTDIIVDEPPVMPAKTIKAAVIGMAGIFPKATDIDEFWRNIVFGRDCITEVPKERWSADFFYDPDTKDTDHVVSKWGGFISKIDFDAMEFGITPQSLSAIEPAQLLSLLMAKRALEDAGFTDLTRADLDDTAVIFGTESPGELATSYGSRTGLNQLMGELPTDVDEMLPRLTEDSFPGVLGNVIAGRISNRLNTGGHNFTVDAACASSLAALDIALAELGSNRAGMVILGGADLHNGIYDYLMFSSTHALSRKGRCATFDSDADGIALGEGIGVLILKRLDEAIKDGNKIYAVIKGSGGSSDGKQLGLTAPSKQGQIRALERAYESAGIRPSEIGLIESHGTGTVVGDQIELRALTDVFLEGGAQPGRTALGSIKSQIGHTKCAAGVAGLIKVINCVRHGILPPTLHLKKPNDVYTKDGPFYFHTEKAAYWREEHRIAGVSGFGFGGTNFHAVVENFTSDRPAAPLKAWPSELFIFPGETAEEAADVMDKVAELLNINNMLRMRDVAYSLSLKTGPVQYAIVAGSRDELLVRIENAREGISDENVFALKPVDGKVAFLFPGQGSQRVNMAADIFTVFPRMRQLLNRQPEYERILFPKAVFTDAEKKAQRKAITDTRNAQPLLGLVDLAMAELLREFGIEPDMAAGHSYGELPALCFAGAFDPENLTDLSRARAEAILTAVSDDPGRMAAVFTNADNADALTEILNGTDNVWSVNFNSPKQLVVAATGAGMDNFLDKAKEAGITCNELNVACAFHSPLLTGADEGFAAALNEVDFREPVLPVWSNTNTESYPDAPTGIKNLLAEHLVNPVHFSEEIKKMNEDGAAVFVEAGPGGTLTKLVSDILGNTEIALIQMERSGTEGLTFLLQGLAKYITTGRMIKMEKLFEGREAVALNIDNPEEHAKKGIVWNVDGRAAIPEVGELPAHAGKLITEPELMTGRLKNSFSSGSVEKVMLSYLENMNDMIQDQRDVMLGYLGAPEIIPRNGAARRQVVIQAASDAEILSVEDAAPEETADDGLLDITSLTSDQIADIVFEIVSEKTGYPVEMLNIDLDLEADLSIDSIKKMEIVGGLRNKIRLPDEDDDNMDAFFEKMISIKKFSDLTAWVEDFGKSLAAGDSSTEGGAGFEGAQYVADLGEKTLAEETEIIRMTIAEKSRPIADKDAANVEGKLFVITDDGNGLAVKTAKSLEAFGAEVRIVNAEIETDLSDSNGLILISSAVGTNRYTIMDLFGLLKNTGFENLERVFVFDDLISLALKSEDDEHSLNHSELPEGFFGFLKSLAHEYPDKRFRSVQFETVIDAEAFADIVVDELTATENITDVFYRDAERFLKYPVIGDVKTDDVETQTILDEESVVVVLGGAQGITPHIIERMAKDTKCRYILVGRSAAAPEDEEYAGFESVDEIRKHLVEHSEIKQPREIEAKARSVFKSSRIAKAVARIEQIGAKSEYINVDVTDAQAFAAVLGEIKEKYGRIDGVIHAAGILEDKLFRDKETESFARVYNTKAAPLKTVLSELVSELKLLVVFSSMAATFGNAGQCDYAAGNSAMNNAIYILNRKNPALKAVAFNWGPWRGAGMVNAGLENEFRKRGVALVELDKGGEFFVKELMYGKEAVVLAIAGVEESMSELINTAVDNV